MRNPFVYGETVSGDNFCNRKKELIQQENGSHVIYDLFFKKWIRRTW